MFSLFQDDKLCIEEGMSFECKLDILLSLVGDPTMRSHCDHQLITWSIIKQNNKNHYTAADDVIPNKRWIDLSNALKNEI